MTRSHTRIRTVLAGTAVAAVAATAGIVTTAPAQAATGCRVDYTVASSWPGGFTAGVILTNLGDRVTGWRLTWSFTAGQTVTQLWNGSVAQSGSQVTVTNAAYNGTIATGGTVSFGFNGSWNGSNPTPGSFAMNGTTCTGVVDESPQPPTPPGSPTPPGGPTPTPTATPPTGGVTPPPVSSVGGSGPYPAGYETVGNLPNHTLYRPASLPSRPMPVFVWGNGGCSANGTSALPFLREIASHGFLAISSGSPNGSGSTTAALLTQSMNWAVAENSRQDSWYYGRIDTTKVAVAGFSCGGLEAYEVSNDPRVTTTMIFSSGLLDDGNDYQLRRLTKPIAYFIGGPSDIAYPNAVDDWGKLPAGLPAFMGNLPVGHGGTYSQPNGGEFGRVAVLYLKWRLLGDQVAGQTFVGAACGLCSGTQWTVQQKNLTL